MRGVNGLLSHEEDSKVLVHTTESAGISLADIDGTRH